MSADKIEIIYVEFEKDAPKSDALTIGQLYYAQWRRNGDHANLVKAGAEGCR